MKRIITILAILAVFGLSPAIHAQGLNNVEVGAYANYFRMGQTGNNPFIGVGGRLSVGVKNIQMEAELGYDFDRAFSETFTTATSTTTTTTFRNSNLRVFHGLFGPKVQMGGPVKAFVTIKAGFDNFYLSGVPTNISNVGSSSVAALRNGDTHFALYPGGGLEAFLGPIGLRFDIGDEIYWAGGGRNNLRLSFGPTIRF